MLLAVWVVWCHMLLMVSKNITDLSPAQVIERATDQAQ
jgi:hypothetical protein